MLELKAQFDRLRAVVGQKEPIALEVVIKNLEKKSQTATLIVKIPFSLGFDKMGLEREKLFRIDAIKPEERKEVRVPMFLKMNTKEGNIPIEVKAIEHPDSRYDKYGKTYTANTNLRVIKP